MTVSEINYEAIRQQVEARALPDDHALQRRIDLSLAASQSLITSEHGEQPSADEFVTHTIGPNDEIHVPIITATEYAAPDGVGHDVTYYPHPGDFFAGQVAIGRDVTFPEDETASYMELRPLVPDQYASGESEVGLRDQNTSQFSGHPLIVRINGEAVVSDPSALQITRGSELAEPIANGHVLDPTLFQPDL